MKSGQLICKSHYRWSVMLLAMTLMLLLLGTGKVEAVTEAPEQRNIILLIGDGLSFSTITATRVFKVGPDGDLAMDTLEHHGWISTHALNSLVTGSASAGTAIATGRKTNNGMVGMLPDGTELDSILDIAQDMGKSTGLVTTSRITHATPAAFGASSASRGNWQDIATDYIFESQPDILLGGGLRFWLDDQALEHSNFVTDPAKDSHRVMDRLVKQGLTEAEALADNGLLDDAREQGYEVIYTSQELASLNMVDLSANEKKVLGLFSLSHMAYENDREDWASHEPHLVTMTKAALDYLNQDQDGFFLMVEAARIDHAQHGNSLVNTIHDTVAFDKAVRAALDFQKNNPNTLVIVTSDHDCGNLALEWPRGEFPAIGEIPFKDIDLDRKERGATMTTRELLSKLDELAVAGTLTPETVTYIKDLFYRDGVWTSGDHTAVDVPIMATGPGAEMIAGRMDNTDVFEVMKTALGIAVVEK